MSPNSDFYEKIIFQPIWIKIWPKFGKLEIFAKFEVAKLAEIFWLKKSRVSGHKLL